MKSEAECRTDEDKAKDELVASAFRQAGLMRKPIVLTEAERLHKIGAIRDGFEKLMEENRFEVAKEIMGGVDRFNFSGVSDDTISKIWCQMLTAT